MRPQKRKMNKWDYKKMTSECKPYSKKKHPKRLNRFEISDLRNNSIVNEYNNSELKEL